MKVSFSLDENDYREFARYAVKRINETANIRSQLSTLAWAYYIFPFLAVVAVYYFWSDNRDLPLGHLYAAIVFVALWALTAHLHQARASSLQLKHFTSPTGFFRQHQELVADNSGVVIEKETSKQTFDWAAITHVHESERLVFLHLDNAQALLIPTRAFGSDSEIQQFMALLQAHVPAR